MKSDTGHDPLLGSVFLSLRWATDPFKSFKLPPTCLQLQVVGLIFARSTALINYSSTDLGAPPKKDLEETERQRISQREKLQ